MAVRGYEVTERGERTMVKMITTKSVGDPIVNSGLIAIKLLINKE